MAITNAQQYRQLRRQGGIMGSNGGSMLVTPTRDGSRPGYYGPDAGHENDPGHGSNAPSGDVGDNENRGRDLDFQQRGMSKKDYAQAVADKEQAERDKLKEEILATPIGRNKPLGPLGLKSAQFQRKRNIEIAKQRALQKYKDLEDYIVGDTEEDYDFTGAPKGLETLTSNINTSIESTRPNLYDVNPTMNIPSMLSLVQDKIRPDTQVTLQNTLNKARDYRDLVSNVPNMTNIGIAETLTDLANRGKTEDQINPREDGGGVAFIPTAPAPSITDQEPEEELTELQQMIADRPAYRFMADGGMTEDAPMNGIMDADVIGGMADGNMDEMGRQMYGLGKLVKKVTRAVKKVAKSPIGKAALLYAGGSYLSGMGAFGGLKGAGMFNSQALGIKNFLMGKPLGFKTAMDGVARSPGFLSKFPGGGVGAAITATSLLPLLGLGTGDENEEEAQRIIDNSGFDLAEVRANPEKYLAPRFAADGGLMRNNYAEGGDAEPVAKKTMPLLDMDGQEMDLRADGGFVPIGRMERADDVPARLSKNEFVFTADAVRNAGEGDIDKGAEVMYNMMKNLESGGEVSEESQGLDGAREMFKTSQRLEEVL